MAVEFFFCPYFMHKPWTSIPIFECGESLISIPSLFNKIEPHFYLSLGAPYQSKNDPWNLREGVINRLVQAQKRLKSTNPEYNLSIFDAWRPVSVQYFMIQHEIDVQCKLKGLDRNRNEGSSELNNIIKDVERFWAKPSLDPLTPPPHSTGAAIDLTLANNDGSKVDMGGEIDEINSKSNPNFYSKISKTDFKDKLFQRRRLVLLDAMESAGFVQHPHEWWHFSYGDQLWAWLTKANKAIYGGYSLEESNE